MMKAAFYECDITPPLGESMPGYYAKVPATDVFERLYARAAVIESDGELAAILSVDIEENPDEMHDAVTKRIYEYTGIDPHRVCIAATHTHRGAPIKSYPEVNCFYDSAYTDVFFRLCADAVILAYKRLQDGVDVLFGKSDINGIAFNRNFITENGRYISWGVGRDDLVGVLGPVDPELAVMTFSKDGAPLGAIVNYACHLDSTGGIPGYSGDFPSIISDRLKEEFGNGFVTVFLTGACGDINHVDVTNSDTRKRFRHREIGQILADGAKQIIQNSTPVTDFVKVIKETFTVPCRMMDNEATVQKAIELLQDGGKIMQTRNLLYYNATGGKAELELCVQAIRIGDACIYALPGEIYVEFGLAIKEKSKFNHNIVAELCNHACGYIPTAKCFDDCSDLYETALCYGSMCAPEAGDIIVKKALEISDKLYKE